MVNVTVTVEYDEGDAREVYVTVRGADAATAVKAATAAALEAVIQGKPEEPLDDEAGSKGLLGWEHVDPRQFLKSEANDEAPKDEAPVSWSRTKDEGYTEFPLAAKHVEVQQVSRTTKVEGRYPNPGCTHESLKGLSALAECPACGQWAMHPKAKAET